MHGGWWSLSLFPGPGLLYRVVTVWHTVQAMDRPVTLFATPSLRDWLVPPPGLFRVVGMTNSHEHTVKRAQRTECNNRRAGAIDTA